MSRMWKMQYQKNMVSGSTSIVSVSMPLKMQLIIEDLASQENMKRSECIQWLIHLGLTYLKLLKEQEKQKQKDKKKLSK